MKKVIIIASIIIALIVAGCVTATILIRNKDMQEEYIIQGTYSKLNIGTGRVLEFDKNNVTATYMSVNEVVYSVTGTYEIADGKITFNFSPEDAQKANVFAGTFTFEYGEDYVKIDGLVYDKQES